MADVFDRRKRSEIMSHIRGTDTAMEMRVRSALWRRGLRFRTNYGPFKIDVAFPGRRIAVFLDSCFWHGCPTHGEIPKTRSAFWANKIARTKRRDRKATRVLRRDGWIVLRFWGHRISRDMRGIVSEVEGAVRARPKNG